MISGWLKKKSSASVLGKHIWHTRYFVLSSFWLEYFKSKKDAEDGKPPTGRIPLRRVKQVVFLKNRNDATRFDLICSGVTFILQAETQQLAQEWVEVLNTVREEARASPVDQEESKNARFWKEPKDASKPSLRGQKIERPTYVSEFDVSDKPQALATTNWFAFVNGRYLPFVVRERFQEEPAALLKPEIEYFAGACAFIDISGFTKLSEHLVKTHGARQGAELLNKYISGYFDRLITVVYEFGGDIIKFAGDAMLVLWRNRYVGGEKLSFERRPVPPKHVASLGVVLSQLVQKKGEGGKITQTQDELSLLRPRKHSVTGTAAAKNIKKEARPMTEISAAAAAAATIKLDKIEKGKLAAVNFITRNSHSTKDARGGGSANVTPRGSVTEGASPRNSQSGQSGRTHSPPSSKREISKHSRAASQSSNGEGRRSYSQSDDFDVLGPPAEVHTAERGSVNYSKSQPERSKNAKKKLQAWLGSGKEQVAGLLLKCVACNLALIQELDNHLPAPGMEPLKLHTGVSAGRVVGLFVGGVGSEWMYYIAGDPIDEISQCANEAKSGECFMPRYWLDDPLLRQHLNVSYVLNSDCVKVNMLYKPPPLFNYRREQIEEKSEAALKMFVPMVIKKAAEAGTAMLPEFRTVFVMFIKLDVPNYYDAEILNVVQRAIAIVQHAVLKQDGSIARLLADDKGTRLKIVFGMPTQAHDDDGVRCVLAALEMQKALKEIGVPSYIGMSTGNVLCCMAGSEKRCEYTAVGFKVIMAARMMSAAYHAASHDRNSLIFCDGDVKAKCEVQSTRFAFKVQPSLTMKGIAQPVPTFTPHLTLEQTSLSKRLEKHKQKGSGGGHSYGEVERAYDASGLPRKRYSIFPRQFFSNVIGRKQEAVDIYRRLQSMAIAHLQQIVVIEAETGMGKSALCYDFVDHVQRANPKVLISYGMAELSEKDHDYFLFGVLLEQSLLLEKIPRPRDRTERLRAVFDLLHKLMLTEEATAAEKPDNEVLDQLRASMSDRFRGNSSPNVKDRRQNKQLYKKSSTNPLDIASLLNPILHTEFPETSYCKGLDQRQKTGRLVDLICSLLERPALAHAVEQTTTEDVYWAKKSLFSPLKETRPLPKKSISSSEISSTVGVLILEDCHNLDPASWRILVTLAERQKQNLMIVITTRPLTANLPDSSTEATFDILTGTTKGLLPRMESNIGTPPSPKISPALASFNSSLPMSSSYLGTSPPRNGSGVLMHSTSNPRITLSTSKRFAQSSLTLGNVPDEELSVTAFETLCKLPQTLRIVLKPLNKTETAEYADVCFGRGIHLPAPIQEFVWAKAQGHPLFIQEICRSLQEKKTVTVDPRDNKVAYDQVALERLITSKPGQELLAGDVQGLIVGRIDRLPLDHQLVVKIASVIGNDIKFGLLCKVVPMEGGRDDRTKKLKGVCVNLVKAGIFFQPKHRVDEEEELLIAQNSEDEEDPDKDTVYSFVQGYLREAAYAMLPHDQCQAIHDDLAHYYENEYARPATIIYDGRQLQVPSYTSYIPIIANHYSLGGTQNVTKLSYFFTLAARRAASKQDFKQVYQWYDQVHQTITSDSKQCFCLIPYPSYQDFKKTEMPLVEAHMNIAWAYTLAGGDMMTSNPMWKCLEYLGAPLPPVNDINATYCHLALEFILDGLFSPVPLKPEMTMCNFLAFQLLETLITGYLEEDCQRRGEAADSDPESDEEDFLLDHSNGSHRSSQQYAPIQEVMQDPDRDRLIQLVWAACKMCSLATSLGNPTLLAVCLAYCWVLADQLGQLNITESQAWRKVATTAMSRFNELLKKKDEETEVRGRSSSSGDVRSVEGPPSRRTSRDDFALKLSSRKGKTESPKLVPASDSPKVEAMKPPSARTSESANDDTRQRARAKVVDGRPPLVFVATLSRKTIDEFSKYQPPYLQPSALFLKIQAFASRGSRSAPPSPSGSDPLQPSTEPPTLSLSRQNSPSTLFTLPDPPPTLTVTSPTPLSSLSVPSGKAKAPPPPPTRGPPPPPSTKTSTTPLDIPLTALSAPTPAPLNQGFSPADTTLATSTTTITTSTAKTDSPSKVLVETPMTSLPPTVPRPLPPARKSVNEPTNLLPTTPIRTNSAGTTSAPIATPGTVSPPRSSAATTTTTTAISTAPRMSAPTVPLSLLPSPQSSNPISFLKRYGTSTATAQTQTTAKAQPSPPASQPQTSAKTLPRQIPDAKNPPTPPTPPPILGTFPAFPQPSDPLKTPSVSPVSTPGPRPTSSPTTAKQSPSEPEGWTMSMNHRARIDAHAERSAAVLPLLSRPCPAADLGDLVLLLSTATINQRRIALIRCRVGAATR